MKKFNLRNNVNAMRLMAFALVFGFLGMDSAYAIGGAIGDATTEITDASAEVATLIYVVGGIVGLVGGLRIFNKWNNGDQDINKELVGWGGASLFLFVVPSIMTAIFG